MCNCIHTVRRGRDCNQPYLRGSRQTRTAGQHVESSRFDRVQDRPPSAREQVDVDGQRPRQSTHEIAPLHKKFPGPLDLEFHQPPERGREHFRSQVGNRTAEADPILSR